MLVPWLVGKVNWNHHLELCKYPWLRYPLVPMMMFGYPCYWIKIRFLLVSLSNTLSYQTHLWQLAVYDAPLCIQNLTDKHDFRALEIALKLGFVYLKVILIRRCLFARIPYIYKILSWNSPQLELSQLTLAEEPSPITRGGLDVSFCFGNARTRKYE